jgi:hypothetical protein
MPKYLNRRDLTSQIGLKDAFLIIFTSLAVPKQKILLL